MESMRKRVAQWEIKYGQTSFQGQDYVLAKKMFQDYLGTTFELETDLGTFPNRHFVDDGTRVRLACSPFFGRLVDGDVIYIQPGGQGRVQITRAEPKPPTEAEDKPLPPQGVPLGTRKEVIDVVLDLVSENKQLRQENQELIKYKDRLDRYQNLEYIFEDEKFMEDWLERNIQKALSNI